MQKIKKNILVSAIGVLTLISPVVASDLYLKINEVGDSAYLKNNKDEVSLLITGKAFVLNHRDDMIVRFIFNNQKYKVSLPLGGDIVSFGKRENLWLQYAIYQKKGKKGKKTLFIYLNN